MTIDDAAVSAAIGSLCGGLVFLALYVRTLHKEQLRECRATTEACEARSKAQQAQIDALIDGDHERARSTRENAKETDRVERPPPKRKSHMARMFFL